DPDPRRRARPAELLAALEGRGPVPGSATGETAVLGRPEEPEPTAALGAGAAAGAGFAAAGGPARDGSTRALTTEQPTPRVTEPERAELGGPEETYVLPEGAYAHVEDPRAVDDPEAVAEEPDYLPSVPRRRSW